MDKFLKPIELGKHCLPSDHHPKSPNKHKGLLSESDSVDPFLLHLLAGAAAAHPPDLTLSSLTASKGYDEKGFPQRYLFFFVIFRFPYLRSDFTHFKCTMSVRKFTGIDDDSEKV